MKLCGMMHLLSNHDADDDVRNTLRSVYDNFTSIHTAITQLENQRRELGLRAAQCEYMWNMIGAIIDFCKCSLSWLVELDGTINSRLAVVLEDYESKLLDFVQGLASLSIRESYGHLNVYYSILSPDNVLYAYVYGIIHGKTCLPSSSTYQLIVCEDDLMLKFIDQVVVDFSAEKHELYPQTNFLKKTLIFLRKYAEFAKTDRVNAPEVNNKLLVSVYTVASRMTWFSFFGKWYTYGFREEFIEQVPFDMSFRFLGVLVLQLDSSSGYFQPLSDQLLVDYVDCIRECLLELRKSSHEAASDGDRLIQMISHDGVWYVAPFLICYQREDKSDIRVKFQRMLRNVGCAIYSCFSNRNNPSKEEQNLGLYDLIVNLNHIQEQIMLLIEYPKVYLLGVLIFFLDFLKKLEDGKSDLIMDQSDTIRKNLFLSISFLKNIESNCFSDSEVYSTTYYASDGTEDMDDKQIRTLIKKSMFLINYNKSSRIYGDELNELLDSAQFVAFKIARYVLQRRCGNSLHWWKMYPDREHHVVDSHIGVRILKALNVSIESSNGSLIDELLMGYVECVQDNLSELLKNKAVIHSVKYQFEVLHQNLSFLMHLLFTYPSKQSAHKERLSAIKLRVHALVMDLGSAIYLYYNDLRTKQKISMDRLTDFNEKLNCIRDETVRIFPLIIFSGIGTECPETDQLGFFDILLDDWKELIECESDIIMTFKDAFQKILENLSHLRSFIQKVKCKADDGSQRLCNCIMDAGYVAEYLLSSFAEGSCPDWCIPLWISEFTEHIELINASVNDQNANGKEIRDVRGKDSQALPVQTSTNVVIGFEFEMELIRKRFNKFSKPLDVISIVGMPGLGKTTLANKVYYDPFTVSYFDVRVWCNVSGDYTKKQLFLTILNCVVGMTNSISRMSEKELSVMVHKQLTGRRYLIVLDNVWEINAFMGLKRFFPDSYNGSRIILTSSNKAIGLGASQSDPIELDLLTDEVSWDLLERKVFGERGCPWELFEIGQEIARKCKGLPVSVVAIATILAKSVEKQGKRKFWEQVAGNLSLFLAQDSQSQSASDDLELSYKSLPYFLKPLFLYLGAFPGDKEIPADKLVLLWIAEGFVHKTGSMSLESQAESNLTDLIDRGLVMVTKRSSDGTVKACRVHDQVRDMCLVKAKEDNFMQRITVSADNDILDVAHQRRLSVFLKSDTTTISKPAIRMFNPPIRTLLSFNVKESPSSVFSRLKLLRVLHSEGTTLSFDASDDILKLVRLRYVSIQTVWNIIPPSIACMSTLETLIVKGAGDEIDVPSQIWEMVNLRHLHINPRASFKTVPIDSYNLENLVTFSTPIINHGEEEKFIRKVPNIQKLICTVNEGISRSCRNINNCPNLESFSELESLKISYTGEKLAWNIKLPLSLKKLSLSKFPLKWSEISMFKQLRNLEVLKLRDGAAVDDWWDMEEDDVFTNLKLLKLDNLDIERWSACYVNFPVLEKVVLQRCSKLEEIPDLGEIDALLKIEVLWCNPSAAKMAKEILDVQQDFGNNLLMVYITPSCDAEMDTESPLQW